jgi:hypothetical protein
MEPLGPTADSRYVSGAVDINGLIQMLAGGARRNMVAILDVAMPAPYLTGKYLNGFSGGQGRGLLYPLNNSSF